MNKFYSNELKDNICYKICVEKQSTSLLAKQLSIPLKTVEKWVTAYYKDPNRFKQKDGQYFEDRKIRAEKYDHLDKEDLIKELKNRDAEIEYLKSILASRSVFGMDSK